MQERLVGRVGGVTVMMVEDPGYEESVIVSIDEYHRRLSLGEVRDLVRVLEAAGNIADVWRRTTERETGRRTDTYPQSVP